MKNKNDFIQSLREKGSMKDVLVCVLFVAVLGGLTLVSLFKPSKAFSETENRYLQTKPALTADAFLSGAYGREYEEYLADQFVARDGWIGLKAVIELARGMREMNGVYFGKDGYLIEKDAADIYESAQAEKNLGFLKAFADKYGSGTDISRDAALDIKIMFVPTASAILKDRLPKYAPVYDQEKWLAAAAQKLGSDVTVPLYDAMAAYNADNYGGEPLYYHTDHHWTTRGAYTGYRAWASSAGLDAWPLSAFTVETVSDDFYGTLNSKVNIKTTADSIQKYTFFHDESTVAFEIIYNEGDHRSDSLYYPSALSGKDKYAFFLGGNFGLVDIKTRWVDGNAAAQDGVSPGGQATEQVDSHQRESSMGAAKPGRRLMLIKDSYANCFAGFAALHYDEVLMVDLRHTNARISELVEKYGITDVLVLYSTKNFAEDKNIYKLLY